MPTTARALVAIALLVPSLARGLTLDHFSDPLPMHPDLPVSQARILWHGSWCDGTSCPPGQIVTRSDDFADQSALAGALGCSRSVTLDGATGGQVVVSIDQVTRRLHIAHGDDLGSVVYLMYYRPFVSTGLGADFAGGGGTVFEFELEGDSFGPGKSVTIYLFVWSHLNEPNEGYAEVSLDVSASGLVSFPFASFPPGTDFSDIDEVTLWIETTGDLDLTIGPLGTNSQPTAASPTSWGRLKALYR